MLYINEGFSFIWGNPFGTYYSWLDVYNFKPVPKGIDRDRILGAEATLWGEANSESSLDNNLWPRTSSLALRLWNM